MTAQRFIDPITRIFTNAGLVAVGYKFYFYQTGTTTPVTTYQDLALTIPNTNPVVSDSNGRLPNIFYSDLSLLKVVVKDANDNIVEGASTDPVGSSYSIASLNDLDVRPTSYWGLTTGTSTAYTLIANPSISSYNNTQTFVVQTHVDCGDNPTLIVSGLFALSWKKYTQQGTKVGLKANDLRAGQRYFCVNDGVDIVCLNPSSLPILSGSETALTIATGAVNLTNNSSSYAIDTEGSASTDDLDTISGGQDGQLICIKSTNDARNVVIKHNTGNIWNPNRIDLTLDLTSDIVFLRYDSTLAKWNILSTNIYNNFLSSKSSNGYHYLPNGMIYQWGVVANVTSAGLTVTFPVAFPTACLRAFVSVQGTDNNASASICAGAASLTATNFLISNSGATETRNWQWLAIGY